MMPQILRDFIEFDFWRRAVLGGMALSVACSLLSVFVVLRRMSFIGQGISHSAFGGVALGTLLFSGMAQGSLLIQLTAFVFCAAVALGIAYASKRGGIGEDSAIGVFFSFSMALGVIFLKQTTGYTQDAYSFLFGSIVAISRTDLAVITVMSLLTVLSLVALRRPLLYYCFDEESAAASGVRTEMLHLYLLLLLSVMIIAGVRMIGVILISAFLVFPGATAWLLARRFTALALLSVAIGAAGTLGGLILGWTMDWPAGAAIVVVQFTLFALAWIVRRIGLS